MTRKIIAIFAALLLSVSLVACNNEEKTEETTTGTKIEVPTTNDETTADKTETEETEDKTEETSEPNNSGAKDPGEYTYSDCNDTLYVYIVGGGDLTIRTAEYEYLGTLKHGDKVTRIGLSDDEDNYWSKITVGDKVGYVATKYLTNINVLAPAGFDDVTKTVNIEPLTGSLKVRDIPSMNSDILGYVTSEEPVKVIGENTAIGWYKVEIVVEGKTVIGYIANNPEYFVQNEETTTETTETVTEEVTTEAVVETETETETAAPAGK